MFKKYTPSEQKFLNLPPQTKCMATFEEISWNPNGKELIYAAHWPAKDAKAVVVLVHGLGEHCMRYQHFAEFLHQKNIALVGFDLPGHGRSHGVRGHAINGIESFFEAVQTALDSARTNYPDIPVILYGHSLGGNISLNFLLRRKPKVAACIATGPWIRLPKATPAWQETLGRLMIRLYPSFLQPNGLELQGLARDQNVIDKYINDPLVHDKVSARVGINMLDAARWLDGFDQDVPVPTLLMHGGGDYLTSPHGTKDFADRVGGPLTLKIWEGFFHEIHNEPEQAQVFDYFYNWLSNKLN